MKRPVSCRTAGPSKGNRDSACMSGPGIEPMGELPVQQSVNCRPLDRRRERRPGRTAARDDDAGKLPTADVVGVGLLVLNPRSRGLAAVIKTDDRFAVGELTPCNANARPEAVAVGLVPASLSVDHAVRPWTAFTAARALAGVSTAAQVRMPRRRQLHSIPEFAIPPSREFGTPEHGPA